MIRLQKFYKNPIFMVSSWSEWWKELWKPWFPWPQPQPQPIPL